MLRPALLVLFSTLALSACSQDSRSPGSVSRSFAAPVETLKICSGYGCFFKEETTFTKEQESQLGSIMAQGQSSSKAEKAAIRSAIAEMEKMARSRLRYGADVARSRQRYIKRRGHMDCVDETRNTTTYLNFLASRGWLRHHTVSQSYVAKGFVITGSMPHRSAVIVENSGSRYVVDSWAGAHGDKPLIIPVSQWRTDNI